LEAVIYRSSGGFSGNGKEEKMLGMIIILD